MTMTLLTAILTRLPSIVLQNQATADAGRFSCYVDNETKMLGCAIAEYTNATGSALFGLIVGGCLMLSLYVAADGDLVVPSVVTTLLGGALVTMLPGNYQPIAIAIMLLGLIGSLFAAAVKYAAPGGGY